MIKSHRHTAIIVDNFDAMIHFYVSLGFTQTRRDMESGEFVSHLIGLENAVIESVKLKLPDGFIVELIKYISHPAVKKPAFPGNQRQYYFGYDHIGVTVEDIEVFIEKVISLGGKLVTSPKWGNSGLPSIHAYVEDPEQNIIHIAQNVSK